MKIEHLALHPEAIPRLATWNQQTWGHLLPGTTHAFFVERFRERVTPGQIPETWLALEGDEPVGMASLVRHDVSTRPELTPWLASVYVAPAFRRRGIGTALVRAVLDEARRLGIPRLYLITLDQMAFYRRLGWQDVEQIAYRGESVTLMVYTFSPPTEAVDPSLEAQANSKE